MNLMTVVLQRYEMCSFGVCRAVNVATCVWRADGPRAASVVAVDPACSVHEYLLNCATKQISTKNNISVKLKSHKYRTLVFYNL